MLIPFCPVTYCFIGNKGIQHQLTSPTRSGPLPVLPLHPFPIPHFSHFHLQSVSAISDDFIDLNCVQAKQVVEFFMSQTSIKSSTLNTVMLFFFPQRFMDFWLSSPNSRKLFALSQLIWSISSQGSVIVLNFTILITFQPSRKVDWSKMAD